jgi:hypothetical protein
MFIETSKIDYQMPSMLSIRDQLATSSLRTMKQIVSLQFSAITSAPSRLLQLQALKHKLKSSSS